MRLCASVAVGRTSYETYPARCRELRRVEAHRVLRSLRLQMRFLVPLMVTMFAAAYVALPLMDRMTLRWFSRDVTARGALVANALSDSIVDSLHEGDGDRLQRLF